MSSKYEQTLESLSSSPKKWLVTGAAGFIGSNLVEKLLSIGQTVVGLDNYATGHAKNIQELNQQFPKGDFTFIEGDICDLETCQKAVEGVDYILHQAALGSVPRSIKDPINTNRANIDGFLNMLVAAKDANVKSFTYAASSSTYGDHPALPKVEDNIGNPLSPYAVTKYVNELYASVFARTYGFKTIGLRYFNVFGRRQNPNGAYAAVIPKWTSALIHGEQIQINGDGETSRDFCYIDNVIQINILAATADDDAKDNVFNVAVGDRTTLNQLHDAIKASLQSLGVTDFIAPKYADFRPGDVRHSQADISKAKELLGYAPTHRIGQGIDEAMAWYYENLK